MFFMCSPSMIGEALNGKSPTKLEKNPNFI